MRVSASARVAHEPVPARDLLRWQFRLAHRLLDATVEQRSDATLADRPAGTVSRAEAGYAQVVLSEDLTVNGVLTGGTPLALSTWAGRTGLSRLPPVADLTSEPIDWSAWAGQVRVDLAALRAYARAVYTATDIYLASQPDDAFDPAGGQTPSCLLSALLLTVSMRRGEIACQVALERAPAADDLTPRRCPAPVTTP